MVVLSIIGIGFFGLTLLAILGYIIKSIIKKEYDCNDGVAIYLFYLTLGLLISIELLLTNL